MLDAFVRIKSARDVLRFAQRFGVLGLCEHGLPSAPSPLSPGAHGGKAQSCPITGWNDRLCRERVIDWLAYVKQARTVLSIAAAIHTHSRVSREEWETLIYEHTLPPRSDYDPAVDRRYLCAAVQWWLMRGRLGFWLSWDLDEPILELFGATYDLLTAQLVGAVSRRHSIAVCSSCGLPYARDRKPQTGRRNYCSQSECKKMADRLRHRATRAKPKEQDQ